LFGKDAYGGYCAYSDPLLNLTFGGVLSINSNGNSILNNGYSSLILNNIRNGISSKFSFLTEQTSTLTEYINNLCIIHNNYINNYSLHTQWWNNFWNRSWLLVSSSISGEIYELNNVTSKYIGQRFLDSLDGRSHSNKSIKFNGQSFYIDYGNKGHPDYKKWGSAYWWQNTRNPYYSTHVCGDNDINIPIYNQYKNQLPLVQLRNNIWFNGTLTIGSGFYIETAEFTGLLQEGTYGANCYDKHNIYESITWIRYYYNGNLELINLLLNDYDYYMNDTIVEEYLIPITRMVYKHYIGFYNNITEKGKMYMYPASSLETWQCPDEPPIYNNCVVNPTEQIAGLNYTSTRLLNLPNKFGTTEDRQLWQKINDIVPDIPLNITVNGTYVIPGLHLPNHTMNKENTELYTVHPYKLYSFLSNKDDFKIINDTYNKRQFPCNSGWCQDILDASLLGRAYDAKNMVLNRNYKSNGPWKYDAFTPQHQDWLPSLDQLEWMRVGLHYMAIQNNFLDINDNNIYLLPAWPCEWNINFKLHAKQNTIVYFEYNATTKKYNLTVEPESRKNDIKLVNCVD